MAKGMRGGYRPRDGATAAQSRPNAAKRPPPTHFLCIPLVTKASRTQLEKTLGEFRNQLPETIPRQAVRPVGTIHLTIGVMNLASEERINAATNYLNTLDLQDLLLQARINEVIEGSNEPLHVTLRSLRSMSTASKTSVLYAEPEDLSQRLYPLCTNLREKFTSAGFMTPEERPLKLHATILNTIYVKGYRSKPTNVITNASSATSGPTSAKEDGSDATKRSDRENGRRQNRSSKLLVDATALIEQAKDTIWAPNIQVQRLAICKMGAKKIVDEQGKVVDEEYEEIAQIDFPK